MKDSYWFPVIALVLSTFLNEMDGIDGSINDGVLVVGATNRPSTLDAAILRPGRFDRVIYVPPPDQEGRKQILASQCDVNLIDVGQLSKDEITGSMTGAEIVGTCREAAMLALREVMAGKNNTVIPSVTQSHVEKSLKACIPLLSDKKVLEEYTMFELEQNKK
jgi:transitional endoplasmic reticulum ATPase